MALSGENCALWRDKVSQACNPGRVIQYVKEKEATRVAITADFTAR